MVFSEGEAQQLIEILTEKAGIIQDTWHTVGLCRGSAEPQEVQGEGGHPVFRQAGPEGVLESGAEFSPGARAGCRACGVEGMGLKVVVPTDVPPHAGRPRRRVTPLLS